MCHPIFSSTNWRPFISHKKINLLWCDPPPWMVSPGTLVHNKAQKTNITTLKVDWHSEQQMRQVSNMSFVMFSKLDILAIFRTSWFYRIAAQRPRIMSTYIPEIHRNTQVQYCDNDDNFTGRMSIRLIGPSLVMTASGNDTEENRHSVTGPRPSECQLSSRKLARLSAEPVHMTFLQMTALTSTNHRVSTWFSINRRLVCPQRAGSWRSFIGLHYFSGQHKR